MDKFNWVLIGGLAIFGGLFLVPDSLLQGNVRLALRMVAEAAFLLYCWHQWMLRRQGIAYPTFKALAVACAIPLLIALDNFLSMVGVIPL